MRLEIACEDRVGIVLDVLNILVRHHIDLKKIELDPTKSKIYVAFPKLDFDELREIMPELRKLHGISDVRTIAFIPTEREHNELMTLLKTLPDGIISIDSRANVLLANPAAINNIKTENEEILGQYVGLFLKGFNFTRWLEAEEVLAQTIRVTVNGEDYIADILPIHVEDDDNTESDTSLAGAVINLKSESRLGQQIVAFRQNDQESFARILANSSQMRRVIRESKKMAAHDASLLIVGETGTGKELIARACHSASRRSSSPFLALNCAALPDAEAEYELFGCGEQIMAGRELKPKTGILEQANGGTVFLDEVGEMSTELQTKLLRFLEDGTFRRVGEEREFSVDVRVICSTQKDLSSMVQESSFREDLFYRLNVLTIKIPPLRERKSDIMPLAEHFVKKHALKMGRAIPTIDDQCLDYIQQYPWPGNVRQLSNAFFRAVTLLDTDSINREQLQLPTYTSDVGYLQQEFEGTLDEAVKRFEANLLRKMYPAYPSSRQLGKRLGLSHTAVANKLREYGINRKTVKV